MWGFPSILVRMLHSLGWRVSHFIGKSFKTTALPQIRYRYFHKSVTICHTRQNFCEHCHLLLHLICLMVATFLKIISEDFATLLARILSLLAVDMTLVAGQGFLCEKLFVTLVTLMLYPQVNLKKGIFLVSDPLRFYHFK